jgi:hypothetical protein
MPLLVPVCCQGATKQACEDGINVQICTQRNTETAHQRHALQLCIERRKEMAYPKKRLRPGPRTMNAKLIAKPAS